MTGSGFARVVVVAAACVALGALGTLVIAWAQARERAVPPRYDERAFARVDGRSRHATASAAAGAAATETWLVAVNLQCDHCTTRCAEVARTAPVRSGRARLVALVVDARARPATHAAAALGAAAVLWDSAGVWRTTWGRRAYGEVLCFDARGRCRRVLPPDRPLAGSSP